MRAEPAQFIARHHVILKLAALNLAILTHRVVRICRAFGVATPMAAAGRRQTQSVVIGGRGAQARKAALLGRDGA